MVYIFEPVESDAHYSGSTADGTTVETDTTPPGTRAFYIQCQTNGIYFTVDGSTPSSTNGLFVPAGTAPVFFAVAAAEIKWLSSAAGGSDVDILHLS